jgi:quercetin dioxygenase-like cupin family protein
MKRHKAFCAMAAAAVSLSLLQTGATAQQMDDHKIITPSAIKWGPAPPSVPRGAQAAVLYGDPSKEGIFAFRLKVPKGYHIPPHTHPKPEIVTVISGTARLGMGEKTDRKKARVLRPGSFFALPPGTAHYFYADTDVVIQLNSTGPWGINYVNPKDDPRQKAQSAL